MKKATTIHPIDGAAVIVLCADESARAALAYWLQATGLKVATPESGYTAREHLEQASARLLITDRALPPWPGLGTLAALKQSLAHLKIVFLDNGMPDSRRLARSAGADIVLPWPLRRASVVDACRTAGAVIIDPMEGMACAS